MDLTLLAIIFVNCNEIKVDIIEIRVVIIIMVMIDYTINLNSNKDSINHAIRDKSLVTVKIINGDRIIQISHVLINHQNTHI